MTIAFHFVDATLRGGQPVPADNEVLVHTGPVQICRSGLHASRSAYDALKHAPGNTLCRVECTGIVEEHDDKLVCRERTILQRFDATELMGSFARDCALSVVHLWDAPQVVLDYLKTGDPKLRSDAVTEALSGIGDGSSSAYVASSAAWHAHYAAHYAARYAAKAETNAAVYAAWSTAEYAAESAARSAADAGRSAARSAAWFDTTAKQKRRFEQMVEEKFKELGCTKETYQKYEG